MELFKKKEPEKYVPQFEECYRDIELPEIESWGSTPFDKIENRKCPFCNKIVEGNINVCECGYNFDIMNALPENARNYFIRKKLLIKHLLTVLGIILIFTLGLTIQYYGVLIGLVTYWVTVQIKKHIKFDKNRFEQEYNMTENQTYNLRQIPISIKDRKNKIIKIVTYIVLLAFTCNFLLCLYDNASGRKSGAYQVYLISAEDKEYHVNKCAGMEANNKWGYTEAKVSLKWAIENGYEPCPVCNAPRQRIGIHFFS